MQKSFSSLFNRNNFEHSNTKDNYLENIEQFKNEKNFQMIDSIEIFCYLTRLELSKEDFENAFDFLKEYFDSNLNLINKDDYDRFLDKYIK